MTLEMVLSSGILNYLVGFLIIAGIYALFTLGLNVQFGETGLINFGIAGFFAIGAYTAALVTKPLPTGELARYTQQALGLDQPFLVGVIAAAVVCGIVAVLIGIPTLRLREDYLAIATIGIAESIRLVFNNEQWLANGSKGLVGIPRPLYDLVPPAYYNYVYLGIVVLVLAFVAVLLERMIRSPWGRVLRAIREDEVVAAAYGKNVFGFKLQALVLGAMVMGVGGALYAHNAGTISPTVFEPVFGTFIVWVMLILGGSGNTKGRDPRRFRILGDLGGDAVCYRCARAACLQRPRAVLQVSPHGDPARADAALPSQRHPGRGALRLYTAPAVKRE